MISSQVLASSTDAARYHDAALVEDGGASRSKADNYYIDERAIATWQGEGAKLLGVEGKAVTKEAFVDHLEGRLQNPKDGSTQDLSANSKERRLGIDFTVAPPKSVSIVGLIGKDDRVLNAHHEANQAALSWMEKHGAAIRVKEDGQNKMVLSGNLLYATVEHHTNRENEPQVHNHNVIMAVSYDAKSEKWRSLTNDELLRIRMDADTVYKRELARGLQKAGYELEFDKNGRDFEIKGISKTTIDEFSARSMQADAWLVQRGVDPTAASYEQRQAAVLASRKAKVELPREQSQTMWESKAKALGVDIGRIVEQSQERAARLDERSPHVDLADARKGVGLALAHLTERDQTVKGSELERQSVFFSPTTVGIEAIQTAIGELKQSRVIIDREGNQMGALTTSRAVADELTIQDRIKAGRGKGVRVLSDERTFDTALAEFQARKSIEAGKEFRLSGEQVNAARNVLMHGDKFQGIQGDAGTGKTAALEFVKEVAAKHGWEMQGIATSTTGARELEKATGIESSTVAAFMVQRDDRLRALKADLERATVDLANSRLHQARVKQLERRDMPASPGLNDTPARYVFDNKTGEVYKSELGVTNPLNTIGHRLMDSAVARAAGTVEAVTEDATLRERLRVRASTLIGTAQMAVGKSLVGYEKVGDAEASAARSKHDELAVLDHNRLLKAREILAAKVSNLERTGHADGRKFLLVMDESSLTGAKDSARLTELAHDIGARVVLQGDTKQHGSVSAGRAFEQIQDGAINLSIIQETRRFDNATPQTKEAIKRMKALDFSGAVERLNITETSTASGLYATTATIYRQHIEDLAQRNPEGIAPSVGIVTLTNFDRKQLNIAVRAELQSAGALSTEQFKKDHLDDPKLTEAERSHVRSLQISGVNKVTAQRDFRSLGISREETFDVQSFDTVKNTLTLAHSDGRRVTIDPSRYKAFTYSVHETREYSRGDEIEARANIGSKTDPNRIANGTRGIIKEVGDERTTIQWVDGKTTTFDNSQMEKVDHAYARTTYKEQGVTTQRELFVVSDTGSKIVTRQALYVALSRAKDSVEIITTDKEKLLENAGRDSAKTTAIDIPKPPRSPQQQPVRDQDRERDQQPEALREQGRTGATAREPDRTPVRSQDNELSM